MGTNTKHKQSFQEIIQDDLPVLVDFTASWCGPCQAMAPILKQVASATKGEGRIIKVDVDKNRALAEKFQIQGVPTFMLFHKGELKWRQSGMQSAQALTQVIRSAAETEE